MDPPPLTHKHVTASFHTFDNKVWLGWTPPLSHTNMSQPASIPLITKSGWVAQGQNPPTHTYITASFHTFDNKVWLGGAKTEPPTHTHITASFHTFDNKVWLGGTRTDAIVVVFTRHPGVGQLHWLFKKKQTVFNTTLHTVPAD